MDKDGRGEEEFAVYVTAREDPAAYVTATDEPDAYVKPEMT